jgi:hypothetical protein
MAVIVVTRTSVVVLDVIPKQQKANRIDLCALQRKSAVRARFANRLFMVTINFTNVGRRDGMDLLWRPVVHSRFRVDIPQVTVPYEEEAREKWIAAHVHWINSERTDYSVYGPYAKLAASGRFVMPFRNTKEAAKRFAELHIALLLDREGFFCWGGVHLFYNMWNGLQPKGHKTQKPCTVLVQRALARQGIKSGKTLWRWPSEIERMLKFTPRNPDLVAYSTKRNEWRFIEVKGPGDRVKEEQLQALAVLHLLTSAPVAVVFLRKVLTEIAHKEAKIAYRRSVNWDWIHPSLRRFS